MTVHLQKGHDRRVQKKDDVSAGRSSKTTKKVRTLRFQDWGAQFCLVSFYFHVVSGVCVLAPQFSSPA